VTALLAGLSLVIALTVFAVRGFKSSGPSVEPIPHVAKIVIPSNEPVAIGGSESFAVQAAPDLQGEKVPAGIDKRFFHDVLMAHSLEMNRCYDKSSQQNKAETGTVVFRMQIEPDGHARSITVGENTLSNEALAACLVSQIGRWSFPKPKGAAPANVEFPIQFVRK
jgi:hypothetical protein